MVRCPKCNNAISESRWIHGVAVCEGCGAAVALDDEGGIVMATGFHVDQLNPDELKTLRTHRRPFRRRG